MIDRYQLRYFLAVVETGNFSRAADRVNVTQPTLSTGIAKLETTIGGKLFFRNSRRVSLTEAGNRFLAHARIIESQFNQLERKVDDSAPARLMRVGILRTVPTRFIEDVLERHRHAQHDERIELVEGSERDLLGKLASRRLDLAISLLREHAQFAHELLFREGYALALPKWHRLADRTVIEPRELADEVMIVRRSCEVLPETSRHFTDQGVRPEFSFRSLNDDKVVAMVGAGLGITLMPESYRNASIVRPKLAGFNFQREVGLLYSGSGEPLQLGSSPLIAAVRETARNFL